LCLLLPAVGDMCPAYTGMPVSLAFQDESSRLCVRGEHGALSSCVCWEAGLTTELTE
jgi:hypothetical protein